jgi:hypothetical protein
MSEEVFDRFIEAMHKQNTIILDNIGVCVDIGKLWTYPSYAEVQHRMYGGGLLSRFWCRHVRSWLQPKRQAEIERAYNDMRRKHQQAFMDAALAEGQAAIDGINNYDD